MKKIWNLKEIDKKDIDNLVLELNISKVLSKLLLNRGVSTKNDAKDFFFPSLDKMPSPFLMYGIDKSIERIILAIERNEKIIIYGDFDCDGITSTAILFSFLESIGSNVGTYNPDRMTEGYGINFESIKELHNQGTKLLITTDCGISENDVITKSKTFDIDFIITDHHTVPEVLPDAYSIINPKLSQCSYPFKDICAAGVVFNLIVGLRSKLREKGFFENIDEPNLARYLDLVSIGTIADSMPITGVNRIFVSNGLKEIKKTTRKGLKHLIGGKDKEKFMVRDISFLIAPKINAAGRVGKASDAVNLLTNNDENEIERLVGILEANNTNRQHIQEKVFSEADNIAQKKLKDNPQKSSLVLYSPDWHPGVLGIIASRIVKKFGVPCAVLSSNESIAKGSLRTANDINLYDILEKCSEYLIQFGGHSAAAGITIKENNILKFEQLFDQLVSKNDIIIGEKINIDSTIDLNEININLIRDIEKMEPFGKGNPYPIFLVKNVDIQSKRVLKEKHLELYIGDSTVRKRGIWFNFKKPMEETNKANIVFTIQRDQYRGDDNLNLNIIDIEWS